MGSVLLVGSVPLTDANSVFRVCCEHIGEHLSRLPDGETGERTNWIAWQRAVFASTPQLESCPDTAKPTFRLTHECSPEDIILPELGYARAAKLSHIQFRRLKREGIIPSHMRFQVSLPTPLAPVMFFLSEDSRASVEPIYEKALLAELDEILATIPHDELSIQWDTAVEFGVLEGVFPAFFSSPYESIIDRLSRLADKVPEEVELGYHLCYGDSGHQHFIEPTDTAWLTRVSNAIITKVGRSVDWIHLPVPRDRMDAAYYKPLKKLDLPLHTELFLGLLHATDGLDGALKRVAAARTAIAEFGIATECGLGRRCEDSVASLMKLHAQVSRVLNQ